MKKPTVESLSDKADSVYTLVVLAAKRGRHLNLDGKKLLDNYNTEKPVSNSLEEIAADKITYHKNSKDSIK